MTLPEPTPRPLAPHLNRPLVAGLFAAFFAFALMPRAQAEPGLLFGVLGWGGGALLCALWLRRRPLVVELRLKAPHYVQTIVQFGIYTHWAWHWAPVRSQIPLIASQIVFAYIMDLLLSWRRYGRFRLGFGPWPVVFSTNLFLWFHDDLFWAQYLLIALAYLSRDFVTWTRQGMRTHIFNPSGIALSLVALVLILGELSHRTWGLEISITHGLGPFSYEVLFAAGLVVMWFFGVVLTTFSAVVVSVALGAWYTAATGVYLYVDTSIPIAVFLGMNLLITDPVSSPRSHAGKIVFGALYGASVFGLYYLLRDLGRPAIGDDPGVNVAYFDKLLFVPVLNLLARPIDWLVRPVKWPGWRLSPLRTNQLHCLLWAGAFFGYFRTTMTYHEGRSIEFWRAACDAGDRVACRNVVHLYDRACDGEIGIACHNLGLSWEYGDGVHIDPERAARAYDRACRFGTPRGCSALGVLHTTGALPGADLATGKALLQRACDEGAGEGCAHLGVLFETGLGVTADLPRARALFEKACSAGDLLGCRHLGLQLSRPNAPQPDPQRALSLLKRTCDEGLAEGCEGLGLLLSRGLSGAPDKPQALMLFKKACTGGYLVACERAAVMLRQGDGVPADASAALGLYRSACERGYPIGCANAGIMYFTGQGVPKDVKEALRLVDMACAAQLAPACETAKRMRSAP